MFGFYIQDRFLDLKPDAKISFRLRYPIDVDHRDILPGSYSVPIDVPASPSNLEILGYPTNIHAGRFRLIDRVTFYAGGIPLYHGQLKVQGATTPGYISVSILLSNTTEIKDKYLSDLTDLRVVQATDADDMRAHALDTVTNPDNHDHAFIPVFNRYFIDEVNQEQHPAVSDGNGTRLSRPFYTYQNKFDPVTGDFEKGNKAKIITPQIKLSYVLNKIATELGYTIDNQFQGDDEELNKIYLYSNHSVTRVKSIPFAVIPNDTPDLGWPTIWEYATQLPKVKVPDFLKAIIKTFFLVLIYDNVQGKAILKPVSEVLSAPERHDWSGKALIDYKIEDDGPSSKLIGFTTELDDESITLEAFPQEYIEQIKLAYGITTDVVQLGTEPITATGIYYRRHLQQLSVKPDGQDIIIAPLLMRQYLDDSYEIEHILPAVPLITSTNTIALPYPNEIYVKGTGSFIGINEDNSDYEVVRQYKEFKDIRLMLYRGLRNGIPYANASTYDPVTDDVDHYDHSILIDGPKGLYQQRSLEYSHYLNQSKTKTTKINLSIADIINYTHGDKVMIDGDKYFVTEMRPVFHQYGVEAVACTLKTAL